MPARKTIVGTIDADVLEFTVGRDPVLDLVLAEADCIGSAAHVTMLSRMPVKPRLFSRAARDRVVGELVAMMRRARAGDLIIEERDQDIHLAVERALTEKLGDLGRRIHTARSRNDQVAVDLRLYGKEQLLDALDEMIVLAQVLIRFGRRYRAVPMVGRTHLQPAMPNSVGVWATAYAEALIDDMILVRGAFDFNDACPLGSAAGYGVPVPIDRVLTARLLGFARPVHNVMYASNARGQCESVILQAFSQVMLSLSRLAEDLILFSMPEFGYFTLPVEYSTGSSIMPQKRNPDVLELVRAKSARVAADASAIMTIVKGLAGGYNRDLQETKEPFLNGCATTRASLRILAKLIEGIEIDRSALKRGFTPAVFATDRVLDWVAAGKPFREAYDLVKDRLGELEHQDPVAAIRRKTHLGATAGLDFGVFRDRLADVKRFVGAARGRYHGAISKLLGVPYPGL